MKLEFACKHCYDDGFQLNIQFETDAVCTAIFGPSGSGKTSVLSMIAGTLKPDAGRIVINDRVVTNSEKRIFAKPELRGIGFVFQEPRLFPHKSVFENLRFGQRWRKSSSHDIDLRRIAKVLEIGDLLDRRPSTLSGGQQQRVALGRAIASGPGLLLMDEPLASLDERLKQRVLKYLERIIDEWEIPTVYVTHSHAEARRIAQRIILVAQGAIVAEGLPNEMFAEAESLSSSEANAQLNLLKVDRVESIGNVVTAMVGDHRLTLSPQSSGVDVTTCEDRYIQFSPSDVIVSREGVDGTSARNHLTGTVVGVTTVNGSLFVAIDVGQIMWSVLTESSVNELQLEEGSPVACLIKAHNLRLA